MIVAWRAVLPSHARYWIVHGRTRPVSFNAQVSRFDDDEVHLDGELLVNRADFGLTWNQMGMASMSNTITVNAVFTRQ